MHFSELKVKHERILATLNNELEQSKNQISSLMSIIDTQKGEAHLIKDQMTSVNTQFALQLQEKDHLIAEISVKAERFESEFKFKQQECKDLQRTIDLLQSQTSD